jgi:hypothetical protein
MPRAMAPAHVPVAPPKIRLRVVLAAALVLGLGLWVHPRASAAWRLHTLANLYADYAACMAGPMGPTLLRDNPTQFTELLRRRIVSARPDDHPFAACEKLVVGMGLGSSALAAHQRRAEDFVEYGGVAADRAAAQKSASTGNSSLSALGASTDTLAELATNAWPFVRSGYTRLMKPSSHTREAVHPAEVAQPGIGSGLPQKRGRYRSVQTTESGLLATFGSGANLEAYRSTDGGLTWQPGPAGRAAESADGCPADAHGRSFVFTFDDAGRRVVVISSGPDRAPFAADLADAEARVVGASCDATGLAVALLPNARGVAPRAASGVVSLKLCPYAQPCIDLAPPDFGEGGLVYPVDVARVDGTTVVSKFAHGVTRVSSSRDQGKSWTPAAVAFDSASVREQGLELPPPWRLLGAGKRLFLYGGGTRADDAYWLLVSDDAGASFRAP